MKLKDYALIVSLVGVGIAAIFGARNPEFMEERSAAEGIVLFAGEELEEARAEFCGALPETLHERDERCADEDEDEDDNGDVSDEHAEGEPEAESRLALDELPEEAASHHARMLELDERLAAAQATLEQPPPDPAERLALWWGVAGMPFLFGLLIAIGGAWVSRRAATADAAQADREGEQAVDFAELLDSVVERVRRLASHCAYELDQSQRETLKAEIEALQVGDVVRLVDARHQIELRYGLAAYASVIGPFSGGERRLNRAWCALVDGHLPECAESLRGAANEMDAAAIALRRLASEPPPAP